MLEQSLASRVRDREIQLAIERDGFPTEIQNLASEISRHRLKGILPHPQEVLGAFGRALLPPGPAGSC